MDRIEMFSFPMPINTLGKWDNWTYGCRVGEVSLIPTSFDTWRTGPAPHQYSTIEPTHIVDVGEPALKL